MTSVTYYWEHKPGVREYKSTLPFDFFNYVRIFLPQRLVDTKYMHRNEIFG